jgi:2-oxo-4-hydroxy-4-carboxy-5-ureidoimidazoline decarboxylase
MTIDEFNALDHAAAIEVVRVWADVPRWIDEIVAGRPYPSVDVLRDTVEASSSTWTRADVDVAIASHPRIGDRVTGASAGDEHSRREQAAAANADEQTAAAILDGNERYEARFDRVFLIRAAGRTAPEILAELTRRLDNADAAEAIEVAHQLSEIAVLRLERTMADAGAAS